MLRPISIAALLSASVFAAPALALQAAPADPFQAPIGARSESDMMKPFTIGVRDENGNRIIINGRAVQAGGSTLAQPGSFGRTSNSMMGSTLGRSTLTATAVGNSISINNVRNSFIMIEQSNTGEVSANINASEQDGD